MKKKLITFYVVATAIAAIAAPSFVTPAMMKRNGLTDEQYQLLWSQGKRVVIEPSAVREWIFKSSRYTNVVDWLDICGKSNDFAKLSHKLQGDNFVLEETNAIVVAENRELTSSNVWLTVENEILVATNAVLEVDAKKAQKVAKAAEKARKKDQKNFEKWVKDTQKARDKSSEDMAEFYDAILELTGEVNF